MTPSLRRIVRGVLALGVIFCLSVVGYRIAGWSWLDAIYMVVITISTIGYGEIGPMTPGLRLYTVLVIVCGLSASAYALGGLFQLALMSEVENYLGQRRMTHEIEQLENHTIICGYGRIGHIISDELHRELEQFVIIERDERTIGEARQNGYLALPGDATEETTLEAAGIQRAKCLVTALPDDAANVFITLTGRNLNPRLRIIARGELPTTQKKLIQAGADRVVLPAAIGGLRMASMVTRPSTVEFLELVVGHSSMDVELDELSIASGAPLIGRTVQQAEARRRHGLLVVAVKRADGKLIFNPDADFVFEPNDTVIVMGKVDDIRRFRQECGRGAMA
ncbi:MAG: TrkA family potassium uptake protein [Pirellulales bacterium]